MLPSYKSWEWKFKCASIAEWVMKMWCIHTIEIYSELIKKKYKICNNEILLIKHTEWNKPDRLVKCHLCSLKLFMASNWLVYLSCNMWKLERRCIWVDIYKMKLGADVTFLLFEIVIASIFLSLPRLFPYRPYLKILNMSLSKNHVLTLL